MLVRCIWANACRTNVLGYHNGNWKGPDRCQEKLGLNQRNFLPSCLWPEEPFSELSHNSPPWLYFLFFPFFLFFFLFHRLEISYEFQCIAMELSKHVLRRRRRRRRRRKKRGVVEGHMCVCLPMFFLDQDTGDAKDKREKKEKEERKCGAFPFSSGSTLITSNIIISFLERHWGLCLCVWLWFILFFLFCFYEIKGFEREKGRG